MAGIIDNLVFLTGVTATNTVKYFSGRCKLAGDKWCLAAFPHSPDPLSQR